VGSEPKDAVEGVAGIRVVEGRAVRLNPADHHLSSRDGRVVGAVVFSVLVHGSRVTPVQTNEGSEQGRRSAARCGEDHSASLRLEA
jgi:hypothetical protein